MSDDCIFCKIVSGAIPSSKVFENDDVIAFNDINPIAPTHVLVVPKKHYENILDLPEPELLKLFEAVKKIANEKGLDKAGFRTVINTGKDAGQEVPHIHIHIIGKKKLGGMG